MLAVERYELSDAQWLRIASLLPNKRADLGRSGTDNRLFVNGCLWVLRSGAHWCDLPERYGKWKTVHRRFSRWCHAGVWERVFETLSADRANQYLMIDSTVVRVHRQAATGKGGRGSGVGAFPRRTDHQGPYAGRRTRPAASLHHRARTDGDITQAFRPALGSERAAVLADKACDSNALRATSADMGAKVVIPSNRARKVAIFHDATAYQQRNRIERCFAGLKRFRRFATRYDRRTSRFAGFVHLAAAMIWLR